MYVALREIRTTWGRFVLMVAVVTMITVLLVVLTALTEGLGQRSTSAIDALGAGRVDRVVLAPAGDAAPSYGESAITTAQATAWRSLPGAQVETLAVGHARLESDSGAAAVALWGLGATLTDGPTPPEGQVVLAADTARTLGVAPGETVRVAGRALVVARVEPTRWYSHSAVATVTPETFAQVSHLDDGVVGTALLVHLAPGTSDATLASLDARAGTRAFTPPESLTALPGYSSERGSLVMIQAFLYGIGALVVVAFVSVWTIQRTRDLAVLRALGASRLRLLGDSLGQAALLLVVGAASGVALGAGALLAIGSAAPVVTGPGTLALPALGVLGFGLVGSALATRRVTHVDPLLALGGS